MIVHQNSLSLDPVASYDDMARAQALGTPNESSLLIGQFLVDNHRTQTTKPRDIYNIISTTTNYKFILKKLIIKSK